LFTSHALLVAKFDQVVGFSYLRGLHLNDSKEGLDSKRDRHEHIGLCVTASFRVAIIAGLNITIYRGKIGIKAFSFFMRDARMKGLAMILETETEEVWPKEIEVLQRMARGEENFDGMVAEIKELVKKHGKPIKEKGSKAHSGSGGSKGNKAGAGKKRKRRDEGEDEGSD
jgi:AP endonuclease-1